MGLVEVLQAVVEAVSDIKTTTAVTSAAKASAAKASTRAANTGSTRDDNTSSASACRMTYGAADGDGLAALGVCGCRVGLDWCLWLASDDLSLLGCLTQGRLQVDAAGQLRVFTVAVLDEVNLGVGGVGRYLDDLLVDGTRSLAQ